MRKLKKAFLPKDRREVNNWCRHYYMTNNDVSTLVDQSAIFVLWGMSVSGLKQDEMFETLNCGFLFDIAKELSLIGEAIVVEFDNIKNKKELFTILDPNYVEIRNRYLVGNKSIKSKNYISLIPDEELKKVCKNKRSKLYKQIDKEIIKTVNENKLIPLPNANHLAIKCSSYDTRGTSMLIKHFKNLVLKDSVKNKKINISFKEEIKNDEFKKRILSQRKLIKNWMEKVYLKKFKKLKNSKVTFKRLSFNKK